MVTVILCILCLLFTSCEYDLQHAFYRAENTDDRTKVCYNLKESESPSPAVDKYSVAVFSDIHFGGKKLTRHEEAFLEWLQEAKADGSAPEFCICLGDIVEHGLKKEFDAYKDFVQKIEALLGSGKVYGVLGNHDLFNNGWDHYHSMVFPYEAFYHFKTKKFSWYCLDSASGTLGKKQFNKIEKLFKNDPAPKIIMTHVPVYSNPLNSMGYFSMQNTYEADMILTLYAKSNVKLVLNGHIHEPYKNYFDSFLEVTVPGFTQTNSWSVIDIDEEAGTISEKIIHGK